MDRLRIIVVLALIALPFSAQAGLTLGEIGQVEATPRPYAALPLSLPLQDTSGKTQSLRQWLGSKPTIWLLADFTCKSLCGPVISIVSDALRQTALRPGTDFRMIVAGLDPQDSAANA